MATVEVAAPAGLIASEEEQVNALEVALKVTEIEPTSEKVFEEETPCSPTQNVPAIEETVDELSSTPGEDSAEKLSVTFPASEPETESAQPESKEEAAQVPKAGADPAKEVSVAKVPAESTAAEEKVEESSAKEEAAVEVEDEKTASVEESTVVVEEPKPAEAAPAKDEKKTEE